VDPATGLVDAGAGTMTAEEVGSLDLSGCELAVVSACETVLGRTAGGEGVLGLQWAFHQAGRRYVVSSLWKVDDPGTAALMTRFYEHLWGERRGPIEAVRRAQLEMLEGRLLVGGTGRGIGALQPADPKASRVGRRVHPRLWAAWTVSGVPAACRGALRSMGQTGPRERVEGQGRPSRATLRCLQSMNRGDHVEVRPAPRLTGIHSHSARRPAQKARSRTSAHHRASVRVFALTGPNVIGKSRFPGSLAHVRIVGAGINAGARRSDDTEATWDSRGSEGLQARSSCCGDNV
jgi:hypothetical protein